MKYLKRFNEELKSSTYMSAARKLRKLGHNKRSDVLSTYAKDVEQKEELVKWKESINTFSKWGTVTLQITGNKRMTGDFHLAFITDTDAAHETILDNSSEIPFYFSIGIIPVDEKTLKSCEETMPDPEFGNGFFWGMTMQIVYKKEGESLKFNNLSMFPYDEHLAGKIEIIGRKGAMCIKNILKACFDEKKDYPSGYNDITNMHDKLFDLYCQKLELFSEYNFSMDTVLKDINSFPINSLYKE